jgi:hypothetical protein
MRIGQLNRQQAGWREVSSRAAQPIDDAENVGGHDHQRELPTKVEVFDSRLHKFQGRQSSMQMRQHPGMTVDPDEMDSCVMQWHREPAGANAEVKDRRIRSAGQLQPWPEIGRVRQARIQLREAGIRLERIVPDDARGQATAWSVRSSALSMTAKPSASCSSLMHSGGLVMIVCQRTKV